VKLAVAQPAQVQTRTDEQLLAELRALAPSSLAAHIIGSQARLGRDFDFSRLGRILAAADDRDLIALCRPARGHRR